MRRAWSCVSREHGPRDAALRKEQEQTGKAPKSARPAAEAEHKNPDAVPGQAKEPPQPPTEIPAPLLGKDEDKRRKDLVKRIEKARAERDRLTREAEDAQRIAQAARTAADEGQRAYETLTSGLEAAAAADIAPAPSVGQTEEPAAPRKNRFVTRAAEKQATAARTAPQAPPDPLRIALDLKSSDAEVREKAAFALASLGPDAQPATRALMVALADTNPAVRVAAAQALGRIGSGASAALAPLSAALTDPDPAVKNAAQAALLAIQGRE